MTLQSSGAISLSNVSVELGRSASATTSLGHCLGNGVSGLPFTCAMPFHSRSEHEGLYVSDSSVS